MPALSRGEVQARTTPIRSLMQMPVPNPHNEFEMNLRESTVVEPFLEDGFQSCGLYDRSILEVIDNPILRWITPGER